MCENSAETCSPAVWEVWSRRQFLGVPASSCLSNYPRQTPPESLRGSEEGEPREEQCEKSGGRVPPCPVSSAGVRDLRAGPCICVRARPAGGAQEAAECRKVGWPLLPLSMPGNLQLAAVGDPTKEATPCPSVPSHCPGGRGTWPPLPAHMAFLPRTLPTPQLRAFALALPLPLEESSDHLHFLTPPHPPHPPPQLKSRLLETSPGPSPPHPRCSDEKVGAERDEVF